jgi:hypothetical protein
MNSRALSQVGIGLVGIWVLVQALFASLRVMVNLQAFASGPRPALAFAMVIPVVLLFGLSYVLLLHNATVAKRLFPSLEDPAEPATPDLPRTLVGLLGVFLLCTAIPPVVQLIPGSQFSSAGTAALQLRALIGYALQVVVGIFLILRPARVLELWQPAVSEGGV